MKHFASLAFALFLSAQVFGQSYKLGDKVADFTLKTSTEQSASLNDFAKAKAVVIVFTNNNCPYAKLYENRLVSLAGNYSSKGVQFVFINPSIGSGDGSETLADMAVKKYNFPYLADEGQKLSSRFGATKTPEAFVLKNNNGEFILKYKGAVDDNPQLESGVKNFFLRNVLDEVLNDKTVTALDKRPTGCLIKRY